MFLEKPTHLYLLLFPHMLQIPFFEFIYIFYLFFLSFMLKLSDCYTLDTLESDAKREIGA